MDVLVQAYRGEPHKMQARITGRQVFVWRTSSRDSIGYPRAYIYDWDESLFGELHAAYTAGRAEDLAAIWKRAHIFNPQEQAQ